MSFLASAWQAIQVGREYSGAVEAARAALAAGHPLPVVVAAFAEKTEGTFDDGAAAALEAGLRRGAEWSRQAALVLGRAASAIETNGPRVSMAVGRALAWVVVEGPRWIARADRALHRVEGVSDSIRRGAAAGGVLAVRASMRLDALLRERSP